MSECRGCFFFRENHVAALTDLMRIIASFRACRLCGRKRNRCMSECGDLLLRSKDLFTAAAMRSLRIAYGLAGRGYSGICYSRLMLPIGRNGFLWNKDFFTGVTVRSLR